MEDGKVIETESEQLSYSGSDSKNIDEMRESNADPIVDAVSTLSKSANRDALFNQDRKLVGKSAVDIIEKNVGNVIRLGAILADESVQAPGAEYLSPDISNTTIMKIKPKRTKKAIRRMKKLAAKMPVIIN